jgi:hypothetical protein
MAHIIRSGTVGRDKTLIIDGVEFRVMPFERFEVRDDWSAMVYARTNQYRVATMFRDHCRNEHDDDSIHIWDTQTNKRYD